jgi:hypothetical protein
LDETDIDALIRMRLLEEDQRQDVEAAPRRLVAVRCAACVAVVAARPGTFKMRPTVTYRADESLVSERMGPVFDWQTVASLDHLVVRRDGSGRMGCLSSALNFGMASVDRRPNNRDHR